MVWKLLHHIIKISIHAPLAGSDWGVSNVETLTCYFNPRSP